MSYLLSIQNVASGGTCFRVDGKLKVDRFLFERDPRLHNRHLMLVTDADWPAVRDDIFFDGQKTVIKVDYIIEPGKAEEAATAPLKARVAALLAELTAAKGNLEQLGSSLNATRLEVTELRAGKDGITPEQIAFLRERDALLEILGPHALPDESPIEAATRICDARVRIIEVDPNDPIGDPLKPSASKAAAPVVEGPKVYTIQQLQKKKLTDLQSIAGALGIQAAHEIKPAAKLINVIIIAQAGQQDAATAA